MTSRRTKKKLRALPSGESMDSMYERGAISKEEYERWVREYIDAINDAEGPQGGRTSGIVQLLDRFFPGETHK